MPADDIAIKVENVSKSFVLPHEKHSSLKSTLINFGKNKGYEKQQVLNDISFEVNKGDFFGIVGRNGSGKSTLLKLLSGIYTPDKCGIHIEGKLTPFIELGVGFSPELSGRENVFLNGALLGFNRREMETMYDDIVAFAELERFMDQKLKNYSSGMQVRLAFSIAIRAQSDILLLDEVLAVGDEAFQRKCYDYFEDLKRHKKTVVIVTHDMSAVERFCNKAILIEKGKIVKKGNADSVANAYRDLFTPLQSTENIDAETAEKENRWGDGRLKVTDVKIAMTNAKQIDSDINIQLDVECNESVSEKVIAAYALKDSVGQKLFGAKIESTLLEKMKKDDIVELKFTFPNILHKGRYFIDLSIYVPAEDKYCDLWVDCAEFNTLTKGVEGYPIIIKDSYKERKLAGGD